MATIYRGTQTPQRIRTDQTAVAELEPAEPAAFPNGTAQGAQIAASGAKRAAGGEQGDP